jgi:hypothetical protein
VMKVYIKPGASGHILATIATGGNFLELWDTHARQGWEAYCRRHQLGLVVFDEELASRSGEAWKKAHWQKTLIGETLARYMPGVTNVCYLDTDILINPTSPNVFDGYRSDHIGLTSLRKNLPFPYDEVLRRMAFLRHTHYDSKYPLDSALFMTIEQLYEYHNLAVQPDEACTGLIMFNVANHAEMMRNWFYKYDSNVQSITNGGEQTHLNFEIQSTGKVIWLDYRFQAIWPFEMAWKYPFLYEASRRDNVDLIRACIEASLYQNHFLHFAGSWHESQMWKIGGFFAESYQDELLRTYRAYMDMPVTGQPKGIIRPRA